MKCRVEIARQSTRKETEERLANYTADQTSGCWNWLGAMQPNGYGVVRHNNKTARTHRVAYEFYCGPIPDGHVVAHSCDNRRCINPDHLIAMSQTDNLRDMAKKGRWRNQFGEGPNAPNPCL